MLSMYTYMYTYMCAYTCTHLMEDLTKRENATVSGEFPWRIRERVCNKYIREYITSFREARKTHHVFALSEVFYRVASKSRGNHILRAYGLVNREFNGLAGIYRAFFQTIRKSCYVGVLTVSRRLRLPWFLTGRILQCIQFPITERRYLNVSTSVFFFYFARDCWPASLTHGSKCPTGADNGHAISTRFNEKFDI